MYIENKYTRLYYKIILKATHSPSTGVTEKHHIIPRCMGGSNTKDNIVRLSLREHRVCHKLLLKMVNPNTKPKIKRYLKVALNRF
jgi:hypothetical protein